MPERSDSDERADPATSDLPLEDPRWVPLLTEHKRLAERLASNGLAAADLTKAMADGVIRYLGRRGDVRRLFSPDLLTKYEFEWSRMDGLGLRPRLPKGGVYTYVPGWVFFVWKPDVDKFWLRFELPPDLDPRPETDVAAIDPPALAVSPESSPAPINKSAGPLKQRVPAALLESRPLPDDGFTSWAKRALPNDDPHAVSTFLWANKGLWKKAGGPPVRRGRKPHP